MNKQPLLIKKSQQSTNVVQSRSNLIKRNYQKKDQYIAGIVTFENGIGLEIKRKGQKITSFDNTYIYNILANSFDSATAQAKRIARKRNGLNIPIIHLGIDLKESPQWMLKIKTTAPFSKDSTKVRKYNNETLYKRK
jgi:hypothetical protein